MFEGRSSLFTHLSDGLRRFLSGGDGAGQCLRFVAESRSIRKESRECGAGVAYRVGKNVPLPTAMDDRAGVEAAEVELFVVEVPPRRRISREVNLKPPVEEEAVFLVGADAPADSVRSLEE